MMVHCQWYLMKLAKSTSLGQGLEWLRKMQSMTRWVLFYNVVGSQLVHLWCSQGFLSVIARWENLQCVLLSPKSKSLRVSFY
jgi:hypothetical protein